jgi:hypothetical protein
MLFANGDDADLALAPLLQRSSLKRRQQRAVAGRSRELFGKRSSSATGHRRRFNDDEGGGGRGFSTLGEPPFLSEFLFFY